MRIIAGAFRGRRLRSPDWQGVRPTSDRLRETLFNLLADRVEGARVLDGYAGTGAVGLEALSRGALHCTFVDHDRRASALIEANASMCGVAGRYTVRCGDLLDVVRSRSHERSFDMMLLDPPYDVANVRDVLAVAAGLLAPDGVLVLERATRRALDPPPSLERVRDVRSGDSTLTIFRAAAGPPPTSEHA
jgi:16S rRNA (guanine966-N2)-methyltransferase